MSQRPSQPATSRPSEAKRDTPPASQPKGSGSTSSKQTVEKRKLTRSGSGYENVPPGKTEGTSEPSVIYTPTYENMRRSTDTSDSTQPSSQGLESHHSDPSSSLPVQPKPHPYDYVQPKKRAGTEAAAANALSFTKADFLVPGIETAAGCPQCKELSHLVSLWELGVSGLTRSCSRILAQLSKARDATLRLECKIKEQDQVEAVKRRPTLSSVAAELSANSSSPKLKRHSVHGAGADPTQSLPIGAALQPESNITNQMYPESEDLCRLQSRYSRELADMNKYLATAIDLCQQMAAACFKTNQPSPQAHHSGVGGMAAVTRPQGGKKPLERMSSNPQKPVTPKSPTASYRPTLGSISEENLTGTLKRMTAGRNEPSQLSISVLHGHSNGVGHDGSDTESDDEETVRKSVSRLVRSKGAEGETTSTPLPSRDSTVGKTPPQGPAHKSVPLSPSQQPFRSHMMSLIEADKKMRSTSYVVVDSPEFEEREWSSSGGDTDTDADSILDRSSTFSDSDVKQVMTKIASLEEDRLKLLETIDQMQRENQTVRLSLYETMGDLENKDLQLTLAMQDLTIATGEIRNAAEMRQRLEELRTEREELNERLSNLEDESAAVKVSLIQLLQQKSATNKTLALENWRLTQKMKLLAVTPSPRNSLSRRSSRGRDGDNISLSSNVSAGEIDAVLHETYLGMDDAGCFVHKQGFLTKQGGKVKNWKRRLFVLDSEGLSYFKTEQPIQKIPLSRVQAVQITHGKSNLPHLFEVHTQDRTFFLSAPTGDEMQSWVGMLQTLMQYNKQRQLSRGPSLHHSLQRSAATSTKPVSNGLPQRPYSEASLDDCVLLDGPPLEGVDSDEEDGDQLAANGGPSKGAGKPQDSSKQFSRSVPSSPPVFVEESVTAGSLRLWNPGS